jgi:hypothetical protein
MSLPECLPPSPPHMRASTTHMATSHAHLLVASACCCLRQKGRRFLSNIPSVRARRHPASTSIACGFSAQSSLLLRNIQFKAYYQKWRECILFVAFVSCLAWIGAGGRRRESPLRSAITQSIQSNQSCTRASPLSWPAPAPPPSFALLSLSHTQEGRDVRDPLDASRFRFHVLL